MGGDVGWEKKRSAAVHAAWRRRGRRAAASAVAHQEQMAASDQPDVDRHLRRCCEAIARWQPQIDEARHLGYRHLELDAEACLIGELRSVLAACGRPADGATIDALRAVLTRHALATSAATRAG